MKPDKHPLAFIRLLIQKTGEDNLVAYAHQLTYSLFLAVFPFLIFLFTLIGYSNLDSAPILELLESALPANIYNLLASIVIDIVDQQRSGLMRVSVFLAIYAASAGFRAFMKGTNVALGLEEKRHFLLLYLISFVLVIIFATTVLISLIGIVFGGQILDLIKYYIPGLPLEQLIKVLRIVLPLLFVFIMILCSYVFVPSKRLQFRYALPGAVFSTSTWTIFTFAFQYYVDRFANYSRFYGVLGAMVAFMFWMLFTSLIFLIGVEWNAVLLIRKEIKYPFKRTFREWRDHLNNHTGKD